MKTQKATPSKKITVIDFDTWAESGGTAGMYGKLFHQGKLRIKDVE